MIDGIPNRPKPVFTKRTLLSQGWSISHVTTKSLSNSPALVPELLGVTRFCIAEQENQPDDRHVPEFPGSNRAKKNGCSSLPPMISLGFLKSNWLVVWNIFIFPYIENNQPN